MVETIIFQDAVFHSCKNYFFIVTFIMLIRVSCPCCRKRRLYVKQILLTIVQLNCGSYFCCCKPFCFFIVHRHIVSLRCCWDCRECSQNSNKQWQLKFKDYENYIRRELSRFRILTDLAPLLKNELNKFFKYISRQV